MFRKGNVIQGTTDGKRKQGKPRSKWTDNIMQWTGKTMEKATRMTDNRKQWSRLIHGAVYTLVASMAEDKTSVLEFFHYYDRLEPALGH